jgi:hypothetical protein
MTRLPSAGFSSSHVCRDWPNTVLTAVAAIALVASPWYLLVQWRTNGEFLNEFIGVHHLGRMSHAMRLSGVKMPAQHLAGRGQAPEHDMAIEPQGLGRLLIGKAFERYQQQGRAMAVGQSQKSQAEICPGSRFQIGSFLLQAKKRPVKRGAQILA